MSRTRRAVPHWAKSRYYNEDGYWSEQELRRNPWLNGRDRKPCSYLLVTADGRGWAEPLNGPKLRRFYKRRRNRWLRNNW